MRGQPFYIDPANGLNTRDNILSIEQNYTPETQNVIAFPDGSFRKRNPCISFSSTFGGAGTGLSSLFASDSIAGTPFMITSQLTNMYSVNSAGVATDIDGGLAIGTSQPWCMVQAAASGGQGPIYMTCLDGAALGITPKQWTGVGNMANWTASSGTLTLGEFMVYFKNRIIMGGVTIGTNGAGINASAVGDPRNWDTTVLGSASAWLTNIDPNDGMQFRGFGIVGAYLLAFKETKTYVVYDLDTGANRPLSTSVGCRNHRNIVSTPYGLCFVASNGDIYITDGAKLEKISSVIDYNPARGTLRTAGEPLNSQQTFGTNVNVYYKDDHLYVCNSQGTNRYTLDYSFITKSWWRHTNTFVQAVTFLGKPYGAVVTNTTISNSNPRIDELYKPGVLDGSVQDGGVSYQAYIDSIPLAPSYFRRKIVQNYGIRRRYHAIRAFVGGTVSLQSSTNYGVTYTNKANYATSAVAPLAPVEETAYSFGVSNTLSLRWTSTDANNWTVFPWTVMTQPRTD